jgi:hypothetical protein
VFRSKGIGEAWIFDWGALVAQLVTVAVLLPLVTTVIIEAAPYVYSIKGTIYHDAVVEPFSFDREMSSFAATAAVAMSMFKQWDTDGSGGITKVEYTDGSGGITKVEYTAHSAQRTIHYALPPPLVPSAPMSVLLCTNVRPSLHHNFRPSLHQCPSFSAPMSVLFCTNVRPCLHQCPSFSALDTAPYYHTAPYVLTAFCAHQDELADIFLSSGGCPDETTAYKFAHQIFINADVHDVDEKSGKSRLKRNSSAHENR